MTKRRRVCSQAVIGDMFTLYSIGSRTFLGIMSWSSELGVYVETVKLKPHWANVLNLVE